MATSKPQNRKASQEEASDSTITYVTKGYEAHDEYEREYFGNYEPDYYSHDEQVEEYTT